MTEIKGEFTTSPSVATQLIHETSPLTEAFDVKPLADKPVATLPPQTHPLHSCWQFWYY